jgi:very-short-patch-repair endonuclease
MSIPRNKELLDNARTLRKNMTKYENHLWYDFLRTYPVRFRRQEIIGNFIADFYCNKAKLVIELDGSQHYEEDKIKYDRQRTKYLNTLGIEVLRFTNLDISKKFRNVCNYIDIVVKSRIEVTPQSAYTDSSPQGEPL